MPDLVGPYAREERPQLGALRHLEALSADQSDSYGLAHAADADDVAKEGGSWRCIVMLGIRRCAFELPSRFTSEGFDDCSAEHTVTTLLVGELADLVRFFLESQCAEVAGERHEDAG